MLYTVLDLGTLGVVEAVQSTYQITGDTTDTLKVALAVVLGTSAQRTAVTDDTGEAADGITVNNVAPGVIYTDRNVQALSDPDYAEKVKNSIPVGFYGVPEDIAGIVSLLCSVEGRYITGQSIFVDGGKSIQ